MNVTEILNGSNGHTAAGFVKTTVANQLQFLLGVSIMREHSTNQTPVFDAEVMAAMGDNGLPTVTKLDTDELIDATAAAFVLLARHIKTPHPETGKREEFLMRFLRTPSQVVARAVDYGVQRQIAQAKATCAMVNANPNARVEAIKAEAEKKWNAEVTGPLNSKFAGCLKTYADADNELLIDCCLEALANNDGGVQPEKRIQAAAKAYLEAQRKRIESGLFAAVDSGVYALAA